MSKPVPSNNVQQGKTLLQNPFEFSDDQILENVYKTHFHCVEKCDVGCLYSVASNVIHHSIEITDCLIIKSGQISDQFREEPTLTSFQQLTAKLRRIACQMICTPRGDNYAHHTTMLILEQLKAYSWDAKALIVLAAFALEFGKFSYLPQSPRDQVEKSLAELNGLQNIQQNSQQLVNFSNLVKKVMQMIDCITEWKKLASAGYDIKDVPVLSDTLHEIPVVVYWTIFTFVTCTGQIDEFTSDTKVNKYELPKNFDHKLDLILKTFKDHLEECKKQIGAIEDYTRRKNIIIHTGKDIVRVLKALIISGESLDSRQTVYNGLTGQQVRVEEFKKKHVLLFISGLENIQDETQLLKSIYEKLKEGPREVEGYKKEDFKILWIPMVEDEWNDKNRKILETILERTKIGWYVVKEFNFSTGRRLIKEVFNYKEKPVIPLISPEGKVENFDTKQLISVWGIDGFPFRTSDHTRLTQQWNWFWSEMIKLNPRIGELIEEDCYIFIFGGMDSKWIQEFSTAVDTLKRQIETIMQLDITIESYPLGKDDAKVVPRFWIAIDSLLASRKQMKGGEGVMDFATREMKRLLFLKQDPRGWVILSKGSNVKLLGQGEAMYRTVKEFEKWHARLVQEVSFDVAFKEYYERCKGKDGPRKCEHSEITNYPTDILARIPCPSVDCGRAMEVTSVNYMCCHGHEPSDIAPPKNIGC